MDEGPSIETVFKRISPIRGQVLSQCGEGRTRRFSVFQPKGFFHLEQLVASLAIIAVRLIIDRATKQRE